MNKPFKTLFRTVSTLLISMPLILTSFQTSADTLPIPGISKGELLYESSMGSPESVKNWVMEGPGKISFADGWMKMWSPDEEWQHVFWAPENFPESFIAQWEMQNLHTEAGLTIVFFAATGPNGEDVMDPSLPERDGTFSFYNNDVLSNYHISYYANNPENAKRPQSHLRKNSGKHVVAKGPIGIEHHSTAVHQVTLMKNKNNIVLYVDDQEIINWTDDGSINGKVYGPGRIALRQMEWSVFRYRNFRVWSVAEKTGNLSSIWQAWVDSRAAGSDLMAADFTSNQQPVVSNFSYAGYHQNERPLPTLSHSFNCSSAATVDPATGYTIFNVTDYGAVPNDGKSDKAAVRKAVQTAEKAIRQGTAKGAVLLFPAGRFRMNEPSDMALIDPESTESLASQSIRVTEGHFILRGCGNKTELYMDQPHLQTDPKKLYSIPRLFSLGEGRREKVGTITQPVTGGTSRQLQVTGTERLKTGDWIEIFAKVTNPEHIQEHMGPYGIEPGMTKLQQGLELREIHQITAINGHTLTLAAPVQVNIHPDDKWTVFRSNRTEEIGLEDLAFRGNWKEKFKHHKSAIHDSGWGFVEIRQSANSWVKNVTFTDFNQGLLLTDTVNSTVMDTSFHGNPGHLSLQFLNSFNNLSMNVRDEADTWHSPGFSHYSSSNVHLDTWHSGTTSPDLHAAQPRINLFDRSQGGWIYGRWGGATVNQPNHLAGLVFWNPENTGVAYTSDEPYEFMRPAKYGRMIMPVVVGMHGKKVHFASQQDYYRYINHKAPQLYKKPLPDEPQAYIESNGQPVLPDSLFLAQLEYRLGKLPEWLISIEPSTAIRKP